MENFICLSWKLFHWPFQPRILNELPLRLTFKFDAESKQLLFSLSINLLFIFPIHHLVDKMSENIKKRRAATITQLIDRSIGSEINWQLIIVIFKAKIPN